MDQSPGELFGPFRLEERLGAGGLAEVWRAVDTRTDRVVAVKRFTGAIASAASERLRADMELVATHALRGHPHVVEVYGGGAEPAPHVVMEYVDGGDLSRELAEHKALSVGRSVEIGSAVASALEAAAEAGIVHGDLKPSNVLIDGQGAIKLADFNVARVVGYTGGSVGRELMLSFAYAAPEVWDGRHTGASDVYALGCVLYHCMAGRPPFIGTTSEVYSGHAQRQADLTALPSAMPAELRTLIERMLAKDPADRPTAHAVLEQLVAISSHMGMEGEREAAGMPSAFGDWEILSAHPHATWGWHARHRTTNQQATVELFFGGPALADRLSRAVSVNERLVPLGAERLLGMNRLLLRPGEGFGRATPPGWIFWVARDEVAEPADPPALNRPRLAMAVTRLQELLAAAASAHIALDLSSDNVLVLDDGSIHVRRPGLPGPPTAVHPSAAVLSPLAALAEPDLRGTIESSGSLFGLAAVLGSASNSAAAGFDAPTVMVGAAGPPVRAVPTIPSAPAEADPDTVALPPPAAPAVAYAGTPPPSYPRGARQRRDRPDRSGAGLVAVLAGLALLLVAAIAVLAFGFLRSGETPTPPVFGGGATTTPTLALPSVLVTTPPPIATPIATVQPTITAPLPTEPVPTEVLPTTPPDPTAPPPEPTAPPPEPTAPPPDPTAPPAQNWAVDISTSDTRAQNGDRVSIRARSNRNVGPSPWFLQVFNPDTGFIHWSCKVGTTCGGGARRENVTTSYQGRISAADGSDVQAQSERVTVTWQGGGSTSASGWQVDLSVSDNDVNNGEFVRITATASPSVSSTPYRIQVFNPDTGFIHWSCGSGTTCGGGARRENVTTRYQARVSAADGSDVQARSNQETVTWR